VLIFFIYILFIVRSSFPSRSSSLFFSVPVLYDFRSSTLCLTGSVGFPVLPLLSHSTAVRDAVLSFSVIGVWGKAPPYCPSPPSRLSLPRCVLPRVLVPLLHSHSTAVSPFIYYYCVYRPCLSRLPLYDAPVPY